MGLVKSVNFKKHKYVGDPINAVKIFNDKEVDEIIILDIDATSKGRKPNISQITEIASEAFMPMAYGGGITRIEEVRELLFNGVEKVILNSSAYRKPGLITEIANQFGSQCVVISVDVKKDWLGRYKVMGNSGKKVISKDPVGYVKNLEKLGAGEIMLTSIDKEGTFDGYDIDLIRLIAEAVEIPLIACGGASELADFTRAVLDGKASAVAAGSMFVFQRPHRAVLISYPKQSELINKVYNNLN